MADTAKREWTASLMAEGLSHLKQADAADGEVFVDLMDKLDSFAQGLPPIAAFGLFTLDGDLLVATLKPEQARQIQNRLLERGVIAQFSPGEYEFHTLAHPETDVAKLVNFIFQGITNPGP